MKKYVDFDGVIFDSLCLLFDEEYESLKITNEEAKTNYIQSKDWNLILEKSEIINDAVNILKELKDVAILTKVNSLENEAEAKIRKIRSLGLENEIILSPYTVNKTDVVNPVGNILVDDTLSVLDDWNEKGGISIFFNKDNFDFDGRGTVNKNYPKITSLEYLKDIK